MLLPGVVGTTNDDADGVRDEEGEGEANGVVALAGRPMLVAKYER